MTAPSPTSNGFNANGSPPLANQPPAPPLTQETGGLNNFLGIARRQAIVIIGVAATYFGYAAWNTLNQTTQYLGNFQILVEPVNAENASLAVPTGGAGGRSGAAELDYSTQIAILRSPELMNEVAEEVRPSHPGVSAGALAGQVNIERLGKTKLLQIKYQSGNAAQTQAVLEALVDEYLRYSLNERQTYLRQGIQFVDEQIETLGSQLNGLQDRLESFQQQNSFTNPETQSEQLSSQVQSLAQREQDLEQSLANARARMSVLQQDDGMQVSLEGASAYQGLLNQVREIDAQIATELTRFKPENPAIQSLQKQRDNLLPLLERQAEQFLDTRLAEIEIQMQSLESQLQTVRADKAQLENQLQVVPTLNRRYTNLQKEIEITNNSLTGFLESRQTLQVEAAQREIPWELVKEPAVFPLSTDVVKDLMTALAMGLALGAGVAFAIDKLDKTYHTTESLKAKVNFPILGVLPFNQQLFLSEGAGTERRRRKLLSRLRVAFIKSSAKVSKSMSAIASSLLDEYDSAAEFVESLRVIHTNLQTRRQTSRAAVRIVTISSAAPGDGKSTLALNWARTAVSMGQRVLLIDGVLRNPQLHHVLELPNHPGLSDLLSTELKPPQGIQQVPSEEKLYAVTGGTPVDNPASLLGSVKMKQLLSYYRKFFDLVIIDTPPLAGLADASIINRQTDGLVLVVRLDQTDKKLLDQTVESLQSTQAPVLGMVVNGSKAHNLALREATLGSAYADEDSFETEDASINMVETEDSQAMAERN